VRFPMTSSKTEVARREALLPRHGGTPAPRGAAEPVNGPEGSTLPCGGENRCTDTCITHESFVLTTFPPESLRFGHPKTARVPRLTEI
jgi:hypothetical protein